MKKLLPTSLSLSVNKSKGFTLIELMVVITIIAFLAIIGIVSFGAIQAQARDGRRRADIDSIATAMEANRSTDPTALAIYPPYAAAIFANSTIPVDPINAAYGSPSVTYGYTITLKGGGAISVAANNASYVACARLEKAGGNYSDAGTTAVNGGSTAIYYCRISQQ